MSDSEREREMDRELGVEQKRELMLSVSLREWEAMRERVERLERVALALRIVVEDVRHLDGTCPHATWVEARDALQALDTPEGA